MKRLTALLLTAALLAGCGPVAAPETQPAPTGPVATVPTQPAQTLPPETVCAETEAETYTLRLHAAVPIFEEPGYDAFCRRTVEEDGVYTIVEEVADAEGNRWGRLKSGAGWVDLTAAAVYTPVTAAFAHDALLDSGAYIEFIAEESEYAAAIAFRPREYVTDVRLSLLEPDMEDFDGYRVSETLFTVHELLPGLPLVAQVVFYGDLTAYGISFTDASGTRRHFAVTVSGRNGMLVLTEYTPEG